MIGAEFQVLFSSNWAMIMIAGGREKKITRRIIEIETLIMPWRGHPLQSSALWWFSFCCCFLFTLRDNCDSSDWFKLQHLSNRKTRCGDRRQSTTANYHSFNHWGSGLLENYSETRNVDRKCRKASSDRKKGKETTMYKNEWGDKRKLQRKGASKTDKKKPSKLDSITFATSESQLPSNIRIEHSHSTIYNKCD